MAKVLIVEDDRATAELIGKILEADKHSCRIAPNGKQGMVEYRVFQPDLVVLDRNLPGSMNGLEVCTEIRESALQGGSDPFILFLTGMSEESDKLQGLVCGGDDYLTKPFHSHDLSLHVTVLLRRSLRGQNKPSVSRSVAETEKFYIEFDTRTIYRKFPHGLEPLPSICKLSPVEFDVIATMLSGAKHRVWSRTDLILAIWGTDYEPNERGVDHCICRIRRKFQEAGWGNWILTHPRIGYSIQEPSDLHDSPSQIADQVSPYLSLCRN